MNPYFAPTEAELLSHSSFLEELSCSLVADRQTADDIVQDTWLAVLQHPPTHSINPIGWLGTVARNLARRDHRTRSRQSYREREVARPEGMPGLDADRERTQSLGRVAAAVETLPEPYRTVVFLRFFENRKPREIAEELDVGIATIKSQIHRGLERLRDDLEEDFGREGADWRGVLCACFGWRMSEGAPTPVALTASSISAKSLGFVALFLIAAFVAVLTLNKESEPDSSVARAAAPQELAEPIADDSESMRKSLTAPVETIASTSFTESLLVTLVDEEGDPVAGATVWLATADDFLSAGTADALGRIQVATGSDTRIRPRVFSSMLTPIAATEPRVGIMATSDEHCPSRVSWVQPESIENGQVTLVLPPRGFRLIGHVLDSEGNPIEGALIERHDLRDGVSINSASDIVVNPMQATRSDALGRFEFASLATGLSWLRFEAADFAEHWERKVVRNNATVEMEVRLHASGLVAGVVTESNGKPVPNAHVWTTTVDGVHELETYSDQHGAFRLSGLPTGERYLFARGGTDNSLGVRASLNIQPTAETSWYPKLIPLPQVRMELVDLAGAPLRDQLVHMRIHSPSRTSRFAGRTDENGHVSIFEQSNSIHRIDIYFSTRYGSIGTFPDAQLERVTTGNQLHRVEVDTSRIIRGQLEFNLHAHDGSTFPEVTVLARSSGEKVNRRIFVGRNKSAVRAIQVVPDELNLIVSCTGLGNIELDTITVESGQTLKMPDVFAPVLGTVRIDWRYPEDSNVAAGIVQHLRQIESKPLGLRIERNLDLSPLETYQLFPGDYSLRVLRNRELLQRVKFTIRSGFETLVEVFPEGESRE